MQDTLKLLHIQRGELTAELERVEAAIKAYESANPPVTLNEARQQIGALRVSMSVKEHGKPPKSRRRNARKGDKREDHILKLLKYKGPMTVAEISKKLGIGSTYMYRVLPRMAREGKVVKDGRTYKLP